MDAGFKEIIIALVYNASLLIVLSVAYNLSYDVQIKQKKLMLVINGLFIGAIGIAIMAAPFNLVSGIVFDTRSILISSAALIFGTIPAIITVVMTSAFRLIVGGAGTGMSCIRKILMVFCQKSNKIFRVKISYGIIHL